MQRWSQMSLPDQQIPDQWKRDALNDKEERHYWIVSELIIKHMQDIL